MFNITSTGTRKSATPDFDLLVYNHLANRNWKASCATHHIALDEMTRHAGIKSIGNSYVPNTYQYSIKTPIQVPKSATWSIDRFYRFSALHHSNNIRQYFSENMHSKH